VVHFGFFHSTLTVDIAEKREHLVKWLL
jgi:hypothetical protein